MCEEDQKTSLFKAESVFFERQNSSRIYCTPIGGKGVSFTFYIIGKQVVQTYTRTYDMF